MQSRIPIIAGMLFIVYVVGSVNGQRSTTVVSDREYETTNDLVYATVGDRELHLDLYVPVAEAPMPIIVWIHGGAWRQGSKRLPKARVQAVMNHGYALASVEYRLSQEAPFPAQIKDCKAAIRWLRANSHRYGMESHRIGAWGSSAGGHLVALLGTSGGVESLEGGGENLEQSSRIQAICNWFGPTDFLQMNANAPPYSRIDHDAVDSPESELVGGAIQDHPERVRAANPITYVTPDDAPFFIMHGDRDPLVPFHQSQLLQQSLAAAGVTSELYRIAGEGHGGPGFQTPAARTAMWSFFDEHLRANR